MNAVPDPIRPRFLRTPDAAVHLGLSPRTLEKHRCYGTGPVYHKLGGRIVYRREDLDAWAEQGLRRSTSDPGVGTVHPAKRLDSYTPPVKR
jgi:predicted DNA-binding transcriptional regulator AlpA